MQMSDYSMQIWFNKTKLLISLLKSLNLSQRNNLLKQNQLLRLKLNQKQQLVVHQLVNEQLKQKRSDGMLPTPKTNKEKILIALYNKLNDLPYDLPTAITNEEKILSEIVKGNISNGGGGTFEPYVTNTKYAEITSGTTLSMNFTEPTGYLLFVAVAGRYLSGGGVTVNSGWTELKRITDDVNLSSSTIQDTIVLYKFSTGNDTITVTQTKSDRILIASCVIKTSKPPVVTNEAPAGFFLKTTTVKKKTDELYLWVCSSALWAVSGYPNWNTVPSRQIVQFVNDGSAPTRLAIVIDNYPPEDLVINGSVTSEAPHLMLSIKIPNG